jgi:membrane fusion protein (multidrug efflux system)
MQFKPAVTALVAAIATASLLSGCKKEEAAPAAPPPQVGVVTPATAIATLTSDLQGAPARSVSLRSVQVNGIILKRMFKEAAMSKPASGYQIDPRSMKRRSKARSQPAFDQIVSDRYRQLVDEQAVSRQEYDTAVVTCNRKPRCKAPRLMYALPSLRAVDRPYRSFVSDRGRAGRQRSSKPWP